MPPQLLLALGVIQLAKQAIPAIEELFRKGEITKEQQQQVKTEYEALRDHLDDAFTGPAWQIEPDPVEDPPAPVTPAINTGEFSTPPTS